MARTPILAFPLYERGKELRQRRTTRELGYDGV